MQKINILNGKKAVIFDLDGVIVNEILSHESAFKEALSTLPNKFDYKEYIGVKTGQVFRDFLSKEKTLNYLTNMKRSLAIKNINKNIIYPYTKEILSVLKEKKFLIGLASCGDRNRVIKTLENFNLIDYFDCVMTSEDPGEMKPSPEIYYKCIKKLQVSAAEAIAVEDSGIGIESAKSAGIYTICILNTYGEKNVEKADLILKDNRELYSILKDL